MEEKKEQINKPELLSPAGSMDMLYAVLHAGADAVYASGKSYGARAYARNFSDEEILRALDSVHVGGKRFYLTVNTLMKEEELKRLPEYLEPFYKRGLDAVLVQDFGAVRTIHECFPDLPIHASTQMSLCSSEGISLMEEYGFSQVVLPRELSLDEIASIKKKTGMKLEVFLHGALCCSYSGQCLFSSFLGGRSGNRGRCAQPCRLPYSVSEDPRKGPKGKAKSAYLLSMKDLCGMESLSGLISCGVDSLKIEGRMKQPSYAASVTWAYRRMLDKILETGSLQDEKMEREFLLKAGNRNGFTDGYLSPSGKTMVSLSSSSFSSDDSASFQKEEERRTDVSPLRFPVEGKAVCKADRPVTFFFTCGDKTGLAQGEIPQKAKSSPLTEDMLRRQAGKLGDTPFTLSCFHADIDDGLFCTVKELNTLRRAACEDLLQKYIPKRDAAISGKIGEDKAKGFLEGEEEAEGIFVAGNKGTGSFSAAGNEGQSPFSPAVKKEPDQELLASEGRKHLSILACTHGQLGAVLSSRTVQKASPDGYSRDTIFADASGFAGRGELEKALHEIKEAGCRSGIALPPVLRENHLRQFEEEYPASLLSQADEVLVRSLDSLSFLLHALPLEEVKQKARADYSLYLWNKESAWFLSGFGLRRFTLPLELSGQELSGLLSGMEGIDAELVIYGRAPLMTTAQCALKNIGGCRKKEDGNLVFLKDRKNAAFPVRTLCDICTNRIYNSVPTDLFRELSGKKHPEISHYRIEFTSETPEETGKVLERCRLFQTGKMPEPSPVPFTYGRFRQGVE